MMKNLILSAILFTCFSACGQESKQAGQASIAPALAQSTIFQNLDVAGFKAKMSEPGVVVLDVRTPGETAAGKIEGAAELDFQGDGFAAGLDKLDKEKTYLVYCKGGGRSSSACEMMQEKGFQKVFNLTGGYVAWSEK